MNRIESVRPQMKDSFSLRLSESTTASDIILPPTSLKAAAADGSRWPAPECLDDAAGMMMSAQRSLGADSIASGQSSVCSFDALQIPNEFEIYAAASSTPVHSMGRCMLMDKCPSSGTDRSRHSGHSSGHSSGTPSHASSAMMKPTMTTVTAKSKMTTFSDFDLADKSISQKLHAGELALWKTRKRVGSVTLLVASFCATACALVNYSNFIDLEWTYAMTLALNMGCSMTHLCLTVILLFAPLADDIGLSRGVATLEMFCIGCYGAVRTLCNVVGDSRGVKHLPPMSELISGDSSDSDYRYDRWLALNTVVYAITNVLFVIGASSAMKQRSALKIQRRLWYNMQLYAILCLSVELSGATLIYKQFPDDNLRHWTLAVPYIISDATMFAIASAARVRQHIQGRLRSCLQARRSVAASAGIAGLMCNCTPHEVLALSKKRFRCMSAGDLTFADLMASPTELATGTALHGRTKPVRLGKCDAFVSHSWHDDPVPKWTRLQEWREEFVKLHGREPLIWFDKYCIDQTDVETDLRGLPVFLSGCKELLVLCGPTYLTRLWCVVEIFTFVHMGGSLENITFAPLYRDGHEKEDYDNINGVFDNFDGHQCNCIKQEDKDKMLGIIMAAFGSMDRFNYEVQKITDKARKQGGGFKRATTYGPLGKLGSLDDMDIIKQGNRLGRALTL
eukprot:TRINITY_DN10024_c0_g1_i1.p1 TRINITY_DN10024_c0_g1~~TRINITY_DN10024_c0_g1_i1.p1  ORF type:complete len:714 (-),score=140.65 TRINITY_DN10024_c0_g1_i1:269-2305(-)